MPTDTYDDGAILCDDQGITIRPTITPDDAAAVARIITEKGQERWSRTSPR